MLRIPSLLALLAAAGPAFGQAFNVDVGENLLYPLPASSYGAAAGQAGVWNGVDGTTPVSVALTDISGSLTAVTISGNGGIAYEWNNNHTFGDDQNLMDDMNDPGLQSVWTVTGLLPGVYSVYTYAWASDNTIYRSIVSVAGSPHPAQTEGGVWPSGFSQGVTHAVHRVILDGGQDLIVTIALGVQFGSFNGLQIVPEAGTYVSYCDAGVGGTLACPCGNPPSGAGKGCENSASTGGAVIAASGAASLGGDTLVFTTAGEKPTAYSIVLQATAASSGSQFGQGVRCITGSLKRLYVKAASGGSITAPQGGDASVSARSAALGDAIAAGAHRYYLVYYRDPVVLGGCAANLTFNATQSLDLLWQP